MPVPTVTKTTSVAPFAAPNSVSPSAIILASLPAKGLQPLGLLDAAGEGNIVPPRDILRTAQHRASVGRDDPRGADTDPGQHQALANGVFPAGFNAFQNLSEHRFGALLRKSRELTAERHLPRRGDHGVLHRSAAEVYSDCITFHILNPFHPDRRTPAPLSVTLAHAHIVIIGIALGLVVDHAVPDAESRLGLCAFELHGLGEPSAQKMRPGTLQQFGDRVFVACGR